MPNRLVAIADADVPTWVGTAGIAVLSDTATAAEKGRLSRVLRRGVS